MKVLKELVTRKHNAFFLKLKNNQFRPELFFEAVSLVNAESNSLSENQKRLRQVLLEIYLWKVLRSSLKGVEAELKGEFNLKAKSNYSVKIAPFIQAIDNCVMDDEVMLSNFYSKHQLDPKVEVKNVFFEDIKLKWSIGVVKNV